MTETPIDSESTDEARPGLPSWLLPALLAALLIVASTAAVWFWWDGRTPSSDSADAGFARDMTDHHAQAVEMSMIVYQRTEDDAIRTLAYDIATSQQAQIGMMQGWLNEWKLSLSRDGAPMAWADDEMADHDMGDINAPGDMPGMLTREAIDSLRSLEPAEMDVAFLQLMIEHHEGGVLMAEAALEEVDTDVLHNLAQTIVNSQSAEIRNMEALLDDRQPA